MIYLPSDSWRCLVGEEVAEGVNPFFPLWGADRAFDKGQRCCDFGVSSCLSSFVYLRALDQGRESDTCVCGRRESKEERYTCDNGCDQISDVSKSSLIRRRRVRPGDLHEAAPEPNEMSSRARTPITNGARWPNSVPRNGLVMLIYG